MPNGSTGGRHGSTGGRRKTRGRVNVSSLGFTSRGRVNVSSLNIPPGGLFTSRAPAFPDFIKPARLSASFEGYFPAGAMLPKNVYVTQGYHPGHYGFDLAAPANTPIYAPVNFKITRAGWGNLGNEVRGLTPEGVEYAFGHLAQVANFKPGETVRAGTLLGYEGSTFNPEVGGYSTGPHLHLQKKKDGAFLQPTGADALYSFYPYSGTPLGGSSMMTSQIKTGAGTRTITTGQMVPAISGGSGSRATTTREAISSPASSSPVPASSSPVPGGSSGGSIQGAVNNAISGAIAQTVDSLKPKWLKGKTALDISFIFGGAGLLIFGLIYILMTLRNGES